MSLDEPKFQNDFDNETPPPTYDELDEVTRSQHSNILCFNADKLHRETFLGTTSQDIISALKTPSCGRQMNQIEPLSQETTQNSFQHPKHFYSRPVRAKCSRCNRIVLTAVEKVPGPWALCAVLACFCCW